MFFPPLVIFGMENSRLCTLAKAIIRVAAQSLPLVHR